MQIVNFTKRYLLSCTPAKGCEEPIQSPLYRFLIWPIPWYPRTQNTTSSVNIWYLIASWMGQKTVPSQSPNLIPIFIFACMAGIHACMHASSHPLIHSASHNLHGFMESDSWLTLFIASVSYLFSDDEPSLDELIGPNRVREITRSRWLRILLSF